MLKNGTLFDLVAVFSAFHAKRCTTLSTPKCRRDFQAIETGSRIEAQQVLVVLAQNLPLSDLLDGVLTNLVVEYLPRYSGTGAWIDRRSL